MMVGFRSCFQILSHIDLGIQVFNIIFEIDVIRNMIKKYILCEEDVGVVVRSGLGPGHRPGG